jgi:hypothetical protein
MKTCFKYAVLAASSWALVLTARGQVDPSAPPPAVSDPAPLAQPLAPAVAQEVITERTNDQSVWVGGHYRWQAGQYVWVAGHWELPPVPGTVWVAPQWQPSGAGYVLAGGSWQTPVASQPPEVVEVAVAPPQPMPNEIILERERPSPEYVWIGGFWIWHNGRHEWMKGHWELPPHHGAIWIAPRWEASPHGFRFVAGYWQHPEERVVVVPAPRPEEHRRGEVALDLNLHGLEIVVGREPPSHPREVIIERDRPSPRHVWIPGFYEWRGNQHVWIKGHWDLPPRAGAVWIEPRWEHRSNGYVFIAGFWR